MLSHRELEAKVDQNLVNRKHDEIERKNLLTANDNLIPDCLKYQNLKESFGNNPSPPARDTPDFDLVFVIGKMKASIQGKDNAIKKLRTQISQLKETRSEADRTLDFRTLDFQITQLTEKVIVLQEQNELFRAENEKVKQHYKEFLLNAACKKALNLLKKGLLIRGEVVEASKRRSLLDHKIQQLSKGSSEGSGIIPEVPDEPKDNSEVAEKQAGNVQTNLTLSSAKLEIQSMVDVPIHQEDPAVQRTLLIDTVISIVTDKIASTPIPPTTQAQVQMCSTSCWKDSSRESQKLYEWKC
ncbi:hypothetical protein Tco_1476539 [Tanacetum coccineum]